MQYPAGVAVQQVHQPVPQFNTDQLRIAPAHVALQLDLFRAVLVRMGKGPPAVLMLLLFTGLNMLTNPAAARYELAVLRQKMGSYAQIEEIWVYRGEYEAETVTLQEIPGASFQ